MIDDSLGRLRAALHAAIDAALEADEAELPASSTLTRAATVASSRRGKATRASSTLSVERVLREADETTAQAFGSS